jgi:hypothetical protein
MINMKDKTLLEWLKGGVGSMCYLHYTMKVYLGVE